MEKSSVREMIAEKIMALKKLATDNTDLFLGIGGWIAPIVLAIASVVIFCINLGVYCYNLGYYHYWYNVPVSLLEEPQASQLSVGVIWSIVFFVVLIANGILGRLVYRKRKYGAYIVTTCVVIVVGFILPLIPSLAKSSVASNIRTLFVLFVLAAFITSILNIMSFGIILPPTVQDKIERRRNKLRKIESKQDKYAKKIEKLNKQIDEMEKAEINREHSIAAKLKETCVNIAIAVFVFFVVGLGSIVSTGLGAAEENQMLTLVIDTERIVQYREMLPEDCAVNGLAIIYQNDDGILVSPCNISEQAAIVYTEFQQFIEVDNITTYTYSFEHIYTASVKLSFSIFEEESIPTQ